MLKLFFNFFLIFFFFIIQLSFLPSLGLLSSLNLVLCFLIFITLINFPQVFWTALLGGILLDLYSLLPFGTSVLILSLIIILVNFLFKKFFVYRSPLSLVVLGFIAILFYEFLFFLFSLFSYLTGLSLFKPILDKTYFNYFAYSLSFNLLFLLFLYLIWKKIPGFGRVF